MNIDISIEETPNPETIKFVLSRELLKKGSVEFTTKKSAHNSPLAKALFDVIGVQKVFASDNFISVTKEPKVTWSKLAKPCSSVIVTVLEENKKPLGEIKKIKTIKDSAVIKKIKNILEEEIRPLVALDGGDIVFSKFESGILELEFRGACGSCPHSTMTLTLGVASRLQYLIPEIKDVVRM